MYKPKLPYIPSCFTIIASIPGYLGYFPEKKKETKKEAMISLNIAQVPIRR